MKNKSYFIFSCVLILSLIIQVSAVSGAEKFASKGLMLLDTKTDWAGVALPAYPTSSPHVQVIKGKVAPGEVVPMHQHPVIGAYYILKGKLTVRTKSGTTLHAKEGNAYAEVTNQWHWGKNEGTEDVELIFFYAGAEGVQNVVRMFK